MAIEAEKESIGIETAITAGCALAVLALRQGFVEEGLQRARAALARATESRMIEAFVVAYRGFPELVVSLLQDRDAHDDLSRVLLRVGDDSIVTSSERSDAERSVQSLSRREKEVLALLAQGMSNAEIGHALFISPVTVKVHVRHIFEKLGVRTRAAAVLRATQLGR
jgi:DNA-binding CsgD family transcriptional regulator